MVAGTPRSSVDRSGRFSEQIRYTASVYCPVEIWHELEPWEDRTGLVYELRWAGSVACGQRSVQSSGVEFVRYLELLTLARKRLRTTGEKVWR